MQQSAFSGARCAHDGDHFSLIDMQADVAQHLYGLPTLVIGLDQISRGERMDGDGISHAAEPVRVASWTRASLDKGLPAATAPATRSEERRDGKEWCRTGKD